jgi:NADH-quinone oxidoreductase subunit C
MGEHPTLPILAERFPGIDFAPGPLVMHGDRASDQICIRVPRDRLIEVMTFLKNDPRTRYEQLIDVTCVDYLNFPQATDRYGVTHSLLSLTHNRRLWVKCFANDPEPEVPSVAAIWKGADWLEREVYDLFGVRFVGHPDLRRLMTWEGFGSHPLRKDYPLRGRGERENYRIVERSSA